MKKKPKISARPCPETVSGGAFKCALERGHAGSHSTATPGRKPTQHATWSADPDGRIAVVTYSHGKKMSDWFEDGDRGSGQPATHETQQGAATPGQRASAAAGNVAEQHDAPAGHRSVDPSSDRSPHLDIDDRPLPSDWPDEPDDDEGDDEAAARANLDPVDDGDDDPLEDEIRSDEERDLARKLREDREAHAAELEQVNEPPKKPKISKIYTKTEREQLERAAEPTTALARTDEAPQMLSVERAREFLAKSKSVDEVRDVADKAKAVALYLRSRDASIESQNDAAEIRLRAERRLGELTSELPKQHGARGKAGPGRGKNGVAQSDSVLSPPTLAEQGIKKQDAAKWQQLAKIPEKKFEKFVEETKAKGERLTSSAPLKMVRQEKKAALAEELRAKPVPQVTGRFDVVVIDPPWLYEKRAEDVTQRGQVDYPQMELEAIKALPVAARAEDNCILWCWTTNAFMRAALECLDAWGFTEKTILTWGKDRMGNGDWLRGKTEHCILAVKGSPIVTLTNQTTLLGAPVREHSRKPGEFYTLVESLCPGTKLDMFGREPREGWVLWGAEVDKFATEAA